MSWVFDMFGLLILSWALGVCVTLVLLDSAPGFVRDHPPSAWRVAGAMAGPLALLGFLCMLLCGAPLWLSWAVVLPFALMALGYSWTWLTRSQADRRRQQGRQALILGLLAILFTSLEQTIDQPGSAMVLAAFAGTAALLGGLGTVMLTFLLVPGSESVEEPPTPYGMLARIVATGLGVTLLALLDTLFRILTGGEGVPGAPLRLWAVCSLLIPLALVAAGHKLFPRWQPPIWITAFGSVLIGQMALGAAIFLG